MSVEIDPVELGFRRPFTAEVGQVLRIKNANTSPIAFKVKTTAPKQYCVRPNSGRIEPGLEVEVTVLLQAMKAEPAPDARCRDKFLVQSVMITGDKEFTNVQQIWDSVDKSSVLERKIRVNWLPAEEGAQGQDRVATPIRRSLTNGTDAATPEVLPGTYSSPSENNTIASAAAGVGPEPETPDAAKSELNQDFVESAQSAAPTGTASAVKSAAEATFGEKLSKPAEFASPASEPRDTLRQRKATAPTTAAAGAAGAETSKKAAPSSIEKPVEELAQTVRQGTEGVPIQIVAIMCLVSFLLAYFFF